MYLPQPTSGASPAPFRATFLHSFRFAWQGIVHVAQTQRNMRVHLAIAIAVMATAAILHISRLEWAVLIACTMIVIAAEMINTVVEALVDLAVDQYHPLAKIAKDAAAGAVLVTATGSAVIGIVILAPPLWHATGR